MSKVYFIKNKEDLNKFLNLIDLPGKIGLKTHFGEKGNTTYPRPDIVKLFSNNIVLSSSVQLIRHLSRCLS